jgi:flavin-dependent dehydrogenase
VDYDVIIAGAGFAGLAAASQLRGKRVLLIDRKEIGTHQTSACGTLLGVMQALDAMDCILQIHPRIVVTGPHGPLCYPLPHAFCTFDFEKLMHKLARRTDADFLRAEVLGVEGQVVRTTSGNFEAPVLIDATGWSAALARSVSPRYLNNRKLSFGIETTQPHRDEDLLFWYDPTRYRAKHVLWVFPSGDASRIGVASYLGETKLKAELERFTHGLGVATDDLHGSHFPYALREPTVGNIFVVGDAAGHCLGLTGEGIRGALYFGQFVGRIARRVLECEISLTQGQAEYRRFVAGHRINFTILYWLQKILTNLPLPLTEAIMRFFTVRFVLEYVVGLYVAAMDPAKLRREPDSVGVRALPAC